MGCFCRVVYNPVNNLWTFVPASFTFLPSIAPPIAIAIALNATCLRGRLDLTHRMKRPQNLRWRSVDDATLRCNTPMLYPYLRRFFTPKKYKTVEP